MSEPGSGEIPHTSPARLRTLEDRPPAEQPLIGAMLARLNQNEAKTFHIDTTGPFMGDNRFIILSSDQTYHTAVSLNRHPVDREFRPPGASDGVLALRYLNEEEKSAGIIMWFGSAEGVPTKDPHCQMKKIDESKWEEVKRTFQEKGPFAISYSGDEVELSKDQMDELAAKLRGGEVNMDLMRNTSRWIKERFNLQE